MAKSRTEFTNSKKKRPGQSGDMISTRVQPELMKQIDAWRREQPDLPSRPEALRRLAMKGLER
jgi:hypothetical protein